VWEDFPGHKDFGGKLIMACGTGKTFTSLRIAENLTGGKGLVLFLAPSIALIRQTLREWTADAQTPINAICICSDPDISRQKKKSDDDTGGFSIVDLALPASTHPDHIVHQLYRHHIHNKGGMTVVFSTYQSIDVISKAQKIMLEGEVSPSLQPAARSSATPSAGARPRNAPCVITRLINLKRG
jgi:predicted helicase